MKTIDTNPSELNMIVETKGRTIRVTLTYFFFAVGIITGAVTLAISFFGL